jgi:hypothetical protein
MRPARILRSWLTATGIALLGASWISCGNSSNGAGAEDAGEDVDASNPGDSTIQDEPICNPCIESCPCSYMDTFFNTGTCQTVTCGTTQMWGGPNFCTGPGCPDAGDDGPQCDPCTEACPCLTGYPPRSDPSTCSLVYCKGTGTTGTWGPGVFCPTVATCDSGVDAANEAGADVIPDVTSEAASD